MAEIDDYLNDIVQCKGVEGIMVLTADGQPIRSSIDEELTVLYCQTFSILAKKAQALIAAIDPNDEPRMLRYRTQSHEILLVFDKQFIMITIQVPQIEVL